MNGLQLIQRLIRAEQALVNQANREHHEREKIKGDVSRDEYMNGYYQGKFDALGHVLNDINDIEDLLRK